MTTEWRTAVSSFRGKRIVILGDVMLDEYICGVVHRISPEAPVPIVETNSVHCQPGGAANVAANVQSLGGNAFVGGVVGSDSGAARLLAESRSLGLALAGVLSDVDRPTTTKTRVLAQSQQIVRIDRELRKPLSTRLEDRVLEWVALNMPHADAFVLSDYAKGVVTPRVARESIGLSRRFGKPIIVDPKGRDYVNYRGASVVTPNVAEAERAIGRKICPVSDLIDAGRELCSLLPETDVLVTRGADGMSLFRKGREVAAIAAISRAVSDVTGAGDTVVAVVALGLACGLSVELSARLANLAAGVVVTKLGTAVVTCEELSADVVPSPEQPLGESESASTSWQ